MTALLTATIGISIEKIYCYCTGTTTLALFEKHSDCATPADLKKHCHPNATAESDACCKKNDPKNCTHSTTKIAQLKEHCVVENINSFKAQDFFVWITELPSFRHYVQIVAGNTPVLHTPPPDLPPCSGRDICIALCVFRC
jgi:hypothetical protein